MEERPSEMTHTEKRKARTVESRTGGDLSSSEVTGESETGLVDLYEPEEWDGPDLFGEYSPEREATMAASTIQTSEPAMPDLSATRQTGKKNA